jgi:hypothetical protein
LDWCVELFFAVISHALIGVSFRIGCLLEEVFDAGCRFSLRYTGLCWYGVSESQMYADHAVVEVTLCFGIERYFGSLSGLRSLGFVHLVS